MTRVNHYKQSLYNRSQIFLSCRVLPSSTSVIFRDLFVSDFFTLSNQKYTDLNTAGAAEANVTYRSISQLQGHTITQVSH